MKMFRGPDHVVEVVVDLDVEAWPVDDLGLGQLQLGCEQGLHLWDQRI